MPREKKDGKVINIKMESRIYDRLEEFCKESGTTKTVAIERILDQFFDAYFQKPEKERSVFE